MPHSRLSFTTLLFTLVASSLAQNYKWPNPQYEALEGLLYEGRRGDGSSLSALVHPCRSRPDTNASIAAEWLRFAFHDMATHDASNGTGGLDGSIVYELDRTANFGVGFTHTLADFENYPNKYVSRSDIIAIGAIFAVVTCGGPNIPLRGGRLDAWQAGATGTPEPHQDINTHTEMFRRSGYNASEMVQMVACGHTLGGVRSTSFPQLVPPKPNSNVPNFVNFDRTTQFDNAVVTEYLDGTTQNVLVVGSNTTMDSDLRVFSVDGNSTMHSLADPGNFNTQCKDILERMLNTVPSTVTLTDEITLLPAKVHDAQLTFEKEKLVFKTSLRLVEPANSTPNSKRNVTMYWCDRYGSAQNCKGATRSSIPANTLNDDPSISPVLQQMNKTFIHYNFVVPIDGTTSISKFWFEVDEHDGKSPTVYNNGGDDYVIEQDQILFVPMLSHADLRTGKTWSKIYTIVAAVRTDSNSSRVYMEATDVAIQNFPAPFNTTVDLKLNSSVAPIQGYSFYSGTVEDYGQQLIVDLHSVSSDGKVYTDDFKQTTFLDNTPYVQPTVVSNSAKSSNSQSSALGRLDYAAAAGASWRWICWAAAAVGLTVTTLL